MEITNSLTNLIELSSSVAIYIPSTTDVDTTTDTSASLELAQTELSSRFGGSTTLDAVGTWMSPGAGLVKEHVKVVKSYTDEATLKLNIDAIVELAETLKKELSQDAIAIEINNKLYLV
jgi:hypothetical protein